MSEPWHVPGESSLNSRSYSSTHSFCTVRTQFWVSCLRLLWYFIFSRQLETLEHQPLATLAAGLWDYKPWVTPLPPRWAQDHLGISVTCRQLIQDLFSCVTCNLSLTMTDSQGSWQHSALRLLGRGVCPQGEGRQENLQRQKGPLGGSGLSTSPAERFSFPAFLEVPCLLWEAAACLPYPTPVLCKQLQEVFTHISLLLRGQWVAWRKQPGLFFSLPPLETPLSPSR